MIFLRNRLASEIFKFFVALSFTMNQHFDSIQAAIESCNVESFVRTLCNIIRNSKSELGTSAISFLAFLLSQEMEKKARWAYAEHGYRGGTVSRHAGEACVAGTSFNLQVCCC